MTSILSLIKGISTGFIVTVSVVISISLIINKRKNYIIKKKLDMQLLKNALHDNEPWALEYIDKIHKQKMIRIHITLIVMFVISIGVIIFKFI